MSHKWKYIHVTYDDLETQWVQVMDYANVLGEKGWELVSIIGNTWVFKQKVLG